MTEEEFKKSISGFEASHAEGSPETLEKWGDLLVARADEILTSDPATSAGLLAEADEKYQGALELDDTVVSVYEKLARIYLCMVDDADPDAAERLMLESAIFELGAGSARIIHGDIPAARPHFLRGFEATKISSKISVIPFTFMLGIDYLCDNKDEKYFNAAKKLQPTANLSGHEEVDILCKAIVDNKFTKALKPTLTARAASKLASLIVA